MNLESFQFVCQSRRPALIALTADDMRQLLKAADAAGAPIDFVRPTYLGRPVIETLHRYSYVVEDTPDGPFIHMLC